MYVVIHWQIFVHCVWEEVGDIFFLLNSSNVKSVVDRLKPSRGKEF